ncbi:MAG: DUF423 domain-containing protein [Pirellulaceae bacterium]
MSTDSRLAFARICICAGGLFASLGVGLGAFGAHGLEGPLQQWYPDSAARKLATWNTAVEYQMYHAIALVVLGLFGERRLRFFRAAAFCFFVGILVFSGLLYALVLSDVKILGAIVPIGGVSMIAGWLLLGYGGLSLGRDKD